MSNNSLESSSFSEYIMQDKNNTAQSNAERRQTFINNANRRREEDQAELNAWITEKAHEDRERAETLRGLQLQQDMFNFQMQMMERDFARTKNTFLEIENNLDQMKTSSPSYPAILKFEVNRLRSDLEVQYQKPIKSPSGNVELRSDVVSPNLTSTPSLSTASFLTDRDAIIAEQAKYLTSDGIYNPESPWQNALNIDVLGSARSIVSNIKNIPQSYDDWDSFIEHTLPLHVEEKARELANNFFTSGKTKVEINGHYYDKNAVTSFLYEELMDKSFNVLYRNNSNFSDYLSYKETGKTLEERFLEEYASIRAELVAEREAAGRNAYNSVDNAAKYGFTSINTQAANRDAAKSRYDDLIDQLDNWKEQTLKSGFKAGFSLPNFLTFGVFGIINDVQKILVLNKLKNGETLYGDEATVARLLELEQQINSMGKEMYGDLSTWSNIGSGLGTTTEMVPQFLLTMGVTSGIGAGVKYGTKTMAKRYIRNMTWKNAARLSKTFAWDAAKFSGVAYARGFVGAPLMPSTFRGYTNEYASQFEFDGNGNFKFTPKNQAAMIAGAWIDGANELASEYYGGVFDDVISLGSRAFGRATGISKVLNNSEIGTWMRRASQAPMSAATKKMLRNAGYTGVLSEPLSEVFGDYMSQTMRMMVGADYSFDHFKNPDYWLTTMGVSTLYGGALTTVSSGANILREANSAKQLLKARKEFLESIKNEDLKNTVRLLGDSEDYVKASFELANIEWDNFKPEDIASAINYIRYSHVFQSTMGDIEGQEQMNAFEDTMTDLYGREYKGEKRGYMVSAIDKNNNHYSIISGDLQDPNGIFKVKNAAGEILEMPASDLVIYDLDTIENKMMEEYYNRFSYENESRRLNTARHNFESIVNPTDKDLERVLTEYGIKKPAVGSKVTLVNGEEVTILEDLKQGKYKVKTYDSKEGSFKEVDIAFSDIISDNPITAETQKKMFADAGNAYNEGDFSGAQEVYQSQEEKVDAIINSALDFRLFDDAGEVKLNNREIIENFGLEDPDTLENYINRVGNRVPQETRESLENALKISRIHKDINRSLAHLIQTSKNRENVETLSSLLKEVVLISNPNTTAEALLEELVNNDTTHSRVRHDIRLMLKYLNSSKVQQKATTKTKTSVTQKDVKGKRGRKQIEKGIKDLKKALKDNNPIEALNAINWIDETLSKVEEEPITTKEKQFVEETRKTLKEQGYEIHPMRGMNYHQGMKATVQFRLNPELPAGTQIIKEVRKPQINKDGVMVQRAEIVVEQGPEIEEETPDISQAVTKEMTGEEPMDFSEPTDNTVESKKEDSITPDPTESNPLIPELESVFKKVDTENMSETPSREEEVETLTEEQRKEVTVQDALNPNMKEFTVEVSLPDDSTKDTVIPDRNEVQGNRIYRYDGQQLREARKQERRTPNSKDDEHGSLYEWLDKTNTDLQGIIDNELSAIAALNPDVKFMMMTEGVKSGYPAGSKMLNNVFLVVNYTDAIKRIHNESRGGVITSEGNKYLVIGVTGFRSAPQGVYNPEAKHYSFLADRVLKAYRNQYTSNTNEASREAYCIHPSMSTKIKDIQAGWMVTQMEGDTSVQERPLNELFEDEKRNPHGITAANSKWLIPTKNEAKPITVRVDSDDIVHGLQIPTGLAGALFLLVPAANGHYIPVSVKIGKTTELMDGELKTIISDTAQQLLSADPNIRNYSIKELCKLLNLTKEGYNIIIEDNEIDFDSEVAKFKIKITSGGTVLRIIEVDPLNAFDANVALSDVLFSKDNTKGIPFQLNVGLQTLTNQKELEMYMESGALKTEAALLGTTNASYTVHSIGADLKEDPYTEQPTDSQEGSHNDSPLRRGQGNGVIYIGKDQYFRFAENSYMDIKGGEIVTDALTLKKIEKHLWLERYKPTPAKVEKGSGVKLYILSENEVMAVTKNGDISFITDKGRVDGIIKSIKEESDNEVRTVNAKEELSRVEEQQQAEQEIPRMLQEEQEADVPEVEFTEDFDTFKDTEVTPVEGSFEDVSFESKEEYTPKEKVSETLTEGVVENVSAEQLPTTDYLRGIQKQLIKEGMTKKEARAIIGEAFEKLKEYGLDTYYTSADESIILSTIDVLIHCRNK